MNTQHARQLDFFRGVGAILLAPLRAIRWVYNLGIWITYNVQRAVWAFFGLVVVLGAVFILYDFGWQLFRGHDSPVARQSEPSGHRAVPSHPDK